MISGLVINHRIRLLNTKSRWGKGWKQQQKTTSIQYYIITRRCLDRVHYAPESYHEHEWQMVGVWALATPKPEKGARVGREKSLEEFAKREFAKAILHTVKNHDGLI